MRAERDRRAAILTAEGVKQSAILTAEGEKQSAILRAEGSAQAAVLNAEGESRAILQVFDAIHRGDADPKLLAYQYLQVLPEIARTQSNKVWFVPTEFTAALGAISRGFGGAPAPEDSDAFAPARPAGTSPLSPTTWARARWATRRRRCPRHARSPPRRPRTRPGPARCPGAGSTPRSRPASTRTSRTARRTERGRAGRSGPPARRRPSVDVAVRPPAVGALPGGARRLPVPRRPVAGDLRGTGDRPAPPRRVLLG